MLLYKIIDAARCVYEVYDLTHALEKLVQTTLRAIIGDMGLDDTLASREEINRSLLLKLGHVCFNWGVEITGVEVLEIVPTQHIQDAMHQQIAAERRRRAAVVEAQGYRKQVKTRAEGDCAATIALSKAYQRVTMLRAKARSEARKRIAAAEAESLIILHRALADYATPSADYMIGWKYIDACRDIIGAARARKIYFPYQTDVVGGARLLSQPSVAYVAPPRGSSGAVAGAASVATAGVAGIAGATAFATGTVAGTGTGTGIGIGIGVSGDRDREQKALPPAADLF